MKTSAKRAAGIAFISILFCFTQIFFCGCGYTKPEEKTLYVCVTADSSSDRGKSVCSDVTATVGCYLEKALSGVESYRAAYIRVCERMNAVSALASAVVRKRGGGYGAVVTLEESPSGCKLIIKLGAGNGGNESAEAYPKTLATGGFVYESIIADIAKGFI